MPKVQVYGSSVSASVQIRKAQQKIDDYLKVNNIPHEFFDVAADEDAKDYMRSKNGGKAGLPQIFVEGEFVGLFEDFDNALEDGKAKEFLRQAT